MRYGMPYVGSKNAIVHEVVNALPGGSCFVDLFGGGGAVSHCAALSGKWETVKYNEFNPIVADAMRRAVTGDLPPWRWISSKEFHANKKTDGVIAICWSFGNNLTNYLFSALLEPWKEAYWRGVVDGDPAPLLAHGFDCSDLMPVPDVLARYAAVRRRLRGWMQDGWRPLAVPEKASTDTLKQMESIERLQCLQTLVRISAVRGCPMSITQGDYRNFPVPKGATVYCDIPYAGTLHGKAYCQFDHAAFWDWAASRDFPVFVSEYKAPDDFVAARTWTRQGHYSATSNAHYVEEKLFLHRRWIDWWHEWLMGETAPLFAGLVADEA